jgi:hypothetical protein
MTLDIRTTIYIAGTFVTLTSFVFASLYKINALSNKNDSLNKIIYLEKGGLNIVTIDTCSEHRQEIAQEIEREAGLTKEAMVEIKCLSENMIILMTERGLTPKRVTGEGSKTFKSLI